MRAVASCAGGRPVALLLGMLGVVGGANCLADEDPAVTPYRPSVSTPAALSAPGWLEVEAGGQRIADSGDHRDSMPFTLKYAFSQDWGVRVGGEAIVHVPGDTSIGDLGIVVKRRFAVDDSNAFGIELGANFPTADDESHSGSGKTDFNLNAIYSADLPASLHTDINVVFTRQGAKQDGVGRTQTMVAAALSGAFNDQWGWVGEFSGTRQSGVSHTAQFLAAGSFSPVKSMTWDFGGARGLTSASPHWTWFAGATYLAERIR
jgi:hypothetical protein